MLLVNASDELFQLYLKWLANKPDRHANQTEIMSIFEPAAYIPARFG